MSLRDENFTTLLLSWKIENVDVVTPFQVKLWFCLNLYHYHYNIKHYIILYWVCFLYYIILCAFFMSVNLILWFYKIVGVFIRTIMIQIIFHMAIEGVWEEKFLDSIVEHCHGLSFYWTYGWIYFKTIMNLYWSLSSHLLYNTQLKMNLIYYDQIDKLIINKFTSISIYDHYYVPKFSFIMVVLLHLFL